MKVAAKNHYNHTSFTGSIDRNCGINFVCSIQEYDGDEILLVYDPDFKYGQNFFVATTEEAKQRLLKVHLLTLLISVSCMRRPGINEKVSLLVAWDVSY